MRVEIPFAYEMSVFTAAGERVRRTYVETFELEIREIAEEDCPVAAVVVGLDGMNPGGDREPSRIRKGGKRYFEPLRSSEWREVDGEHGWRPTAFRQGAEDVQKRLTTALAQKIGAVSLASEVKLKGPPKQSTIDYDWGRKDAIDRLRLMAARLAFVGGDLHVAIGEPIYIFDKGGMTLICADGQYAGEKFSLTEKAAAQACADMRTRDRDGRPVAKPAWMPTSEVIDADLLTWSQPDVEVVKAAKDFFDGVTRRAASQPIEVLHAYADLRDLFGRHSRWDAPKIDVENDLLPLMAALGDAVRDHGRDLGDEIQDFDRRLGDYTCRTRAAELEGPAFAL